MQQYLSLGVSTLVALMAAHRAAAAAPATAPSSKDEIDEIGACPGSASPRTGPSRAILVLED